MEESTPGRNRANDCTAQLYCTGFNEVAGREIVKSGVEKTGCREETCKAVKLRSDGALKLLIALTAGWVKLGRANEFAGWERVRLAGLEKLIPVDCSLSPDDEVEVEEEVKDACVPEDAAPKSKAWAGMV